MSLATLLPLCGLWWGVVGLACSLCHGESFMGCLLSAVRSRLGKQPGGAFRCAGKKEGPSEVVDDGPLALSRTTPELDSEDRRAGVAAVTRRGREGFVAPVRAALLATATARSVAYSQEIPQPL